MKQKTTFDKIYEIIRQIPKGNVASYGQIAELSGNRHLARVVGYALHAVPADSDIPCHRVVNRNGEVSAAFEHEGINRQIELLEAEGVEFVDGHVDMTKYQWGKRVF